MTAIWFKRHGDVLIVSDDSLNVGLIVTEIVRLGFLGAVIQPTVDLAKRCLDDRGTFAAIVVDLQAGHIELCRYLRDHRGGIPVMVVVNPSEDVETLLYDRMGMDFVRRPVRVRELVARTVALIPQV